jgi:hypothetical protein
MASLLPVNHDHEDDTDISSWTGRQEKETDFPSAFLQVVAGGEIQFPGMEFASHDTRRLERVTSSFLFNTHLILRSEGNGTDSTLDAAACIIITTEFAEFTCSQRVG